MTTTRILSNTPALDLETLERVRQALTHRRREVSRCKEATQSPGMTVLPEIDRALERVDKGEFGHCNQCKDGVEPDRLVHDFRTEVCLGHYSQEERRDLEQDLELAALVQQDLLPTRLPEIPGWELASLARPARIIGGDHHDFIRLKNGNHVIVIADVMGKGMAAGLVAANLQSALHILGPQHEDTGSLATRINELLSYNLNVISFVSLFLGEINEDGGALRWTNAGHEPPVHQRINESQMTLMASNGPALGIVPDARYETESTRINRGDLLLLYTDGLVESRGQKGELFGLNRVLGCFDSDNHRPAGFLQHIHDCARDFATGDFSDDLTAIALKRT